MKLVSIVLAFTATFVVLSSASVPSTAKTSDVVTVELPVQYYDFEDSPIYISVKK